MLVVNFAEKVLGMKEKGKREMMVISEIIEDEHDDDNDDDDVEI